MNLRDGHVKSLGHLGWRKPGIQLGVFRTAVMSEDLCERLSSVIKENRSGPRIHPWGTSQMRPRGDSRPPGRICSEGENLARTMPEFKRAEIRFTVKGRYKLPHALHAIRSQSQE